MQKKPNLCAVCGAPMRVAWTGWTNGNPSTPASDTEFEVRYECTGEGCTHEFSELS